MSHAAVLLAGGKSSRMGRDKAALLVDGEPLWRRQLEILGNTKPSELFISGRSDGPYAGCGVEILADEIPGSGPLAGIAAALRRAEADRLLVLAVDMPSMTAKFLSALLEHSRRTGMGVVPTLAADGSGRVHTASSLEPLAAVYLAGALAVADECLAVGERKMESFVGKLEALRLAVILPVPREEEVLFDNWNAPGDVR